MIKNTVIAAMYLAGAFVSGGYYHRDAKANCFSNVYLKTVSMMVIWPIMAPTFAIGPLLRSACND